MPSTERFRARPSGRASKRRPLSRNCPFRSGQQPKLREISCGLSITCFLVSPVLGRIVGGDKALFPPAHAGNRAPTRQRTGLTGTQGPARSGWSRPRPAACGSGPLIERQGRTVEAHGQETRRAFIQAAFLLIQSSRTLRCAVAATTIPLPESVLTGLLPGGYLARVRRCSCRIPRRFGGVSRKAGHSWASCHSSDGRG
jgi:hypothetical protein